MTDVGRKIRDLRTARGLTLPELAEKAGISKGYLWRIEESDEEGSGSRPSADTLTKVASSLGVPIDVLADDTAHQMPVHNVTQPLPSLPPSLRAFIKKRRADDDPLDEEEVWMLAGIRYRGMTPTTSADWDYVLQSIKRSVSP